MTVAGPGRPRLAGRRRPGDTPAEEILDAAAELFTTRGYAATTTRRIAEAVGMRQASLYNHFATKDDLLATLLESTVAPSGAVAARLLAAPGAPARRLHELVAFDAGQLCGGRWNLGALYLLPEVRAERFAGFQATRGRLRDAYRELAVQVCTGAGTDPAGLADLPFRLTESLINARWDGEDLTDAPARTADAALRLLGAGHGGDARTAAAPGGTSGD